MFAIAFAVTRNDGGARPDARVGGAAADVQGLLFTAQYGIPSKLGFGGVSVEVIDQLKASDWGQRGNEADKGVFSPAIVGLHDGVNVGVGLDAAMRGVPAEAKAL